MPCEQPDNQRGMTGEGAREGVPEVAIIRQTSKFDPIDLPGLLYWHALPP
ncbi:MAG: hypothetical protein OXB98_07365 [Bryobacterales bacterium]|nr:hypothetical protein [Bryobacterales bacterium]